MLEKRRGRRVSALESPRGSKEMGNFQTEGWNGLREAKSSLEIVLSRRNYHQGNLRYSNSVLRYFEGLCS